MSLTISAKQFAAVSPNYTANLSSHGDWAEYVASITVPSDFRAGGGGTISCANVGPFGANWTNTIGNGKVGWNDGTNTPSNSRFDMVKNTCNDGGGGNTGYGFALTFPADTRLRVAQIFMQFSGMQLKALAALSDSSSAAVMDTSLNFATNSYAGGIYTIAYQAASPGQTMTVTVTENAANTSFGNMGLQAGLWDIVSNAVLLGQNMY